MAEILTNDIWTYAPPKTERASAIKFLPLRGVLPFDGVRNPTARSTTSHRIAFTYHTAANDFRPRLGLAESAAEEAVAYEALLSPELYDLQMQPLTVDFMHPDGRNRQHTYDLGLTLRSGLRRLVFVRNGHSLARTSVQAEIAAIRAAIPKRKAHDMIVVNADRYTRQRRDNLLRIYQVTREPDPEADDIVANAALSFSGPVLVKHIVARSGLPTGRAVHSLWRLIGQRKLLANMDNLICLHSRVGVKSQ